MAQTLILAAGQTAATSSPDVDVVPGTPATLQLFTPSGVLPSAVQLQVFTIVNTVEMPLGQLSAALDGGRMVIAAPCTVRVKRADISTYGKDIGVTVDQ